MARGGQGLARVAVVVRAGAAPLWWLGVVAAGAGVVPPGLSGRRIGVLAGAALFLVAAGAVAWARRGRYLAPERAAVRAGKHDVLQDRAVTLRNWRRGHRWWLLLAFALALGSSFALPAAGGLLLTGLGTGLRLKAAWLGRRELAAGRLHWVPVDRLSARGGRPTGARVGGYRVTGLGAGDAAPGGGRR
ncbi:hypothetical protein [Streptomyces stelliscabiei]|uniref:hypothetical protein n=1 Tax=Streptomyces stelliscabiei TaxID=146820 RepID=UPI0029AFFCD1|nr:hypothetical protein [Streptomyces stelliscabiei]MDX2551938.1 hypothetical protein [Streptomyces stelliscabiei]MDX2609694.1 hypothetical protein [Streptomyces stelliscabiei]MDX2636912.1 hypothetical protein [Streptomyces stelliscabiei]MDX2660329.1 hypothetical protein [Streptomyces stelliscabiei]MDX2710638.1 hypothetical protein [Streptomyces stelliscabiei]